MSKQRNEGPVQGQFRQIENTVTDLRGSDINSFDRHIKKLQRLIHSPDLDVISQELAAPVELDSWLEGGPYPDSNMVGSKKLIWPSDPKQEMGLVVQLIDRFAKDPDMALKFSISYYDGGDTITSNLQHLVAQTIVPFARDYIHYAETALKISGKTALPKSEPNLAIFISHSSHDEVVAFKLVELLRSALNLTADQIRCTSVDGYGLEPGAHSETKIREEVLSAKILIGLITPSSVSSAYVLFELGARWGTRQHLVPLLAGIEPKDLRGPLKALNAIPGKRDQLLHVMVEDIAKILDQPIKGVGAYSKYVSQLANLCEAVVAQHEPTASTRQATPNLIFTGSYENHHLGHWRRFVECRPGQI